MPMPAAEIEIPDQAGNPDAKVEMRALADDEDHWAATVISQEFAGKSKLQQHQLVYKALGSHMGGALHALQLQTFAPK